MLPSRTFSIQLLWFAVGVWLTAGTQDVYGLDTTLTEEDKDSGLSLTDFAIVPGTLWCGSGNVSSSPDNLGWFHRTDECCRTHDQCNDSIPAGKSKHGLVNSAPYTRLHCSCDDKFYCCLRKVNNMVARKVARIYFTMLETKCYREDYPILRCKRYYSILKRRCEEYELDTKSAKQWQWFDVPIFSKVMRLLSMSDDRICPKKRSNVARSTMLGSGSLGNIPKDEATKDEATKDGATKDGATKDGAPKQRAAKDVNGIETPVIGYKLILCAHIALRRL